MNTKLIFTLLSNKDKAKWSYWPTNFMAAFSDLSPDHYNFRICNFLINNRTGEKFFLRFNIVVAHKNIGAYKNLI